MNFRQIIVACGIKKTKQHMDKDVFRRDLGDLAPIYQEVLRRLTTKLGA